MGGGVFGGGSPKGVGGGSRPRDERFLDSLCAAKSTSLDFDPAPSLIGSKSSANGSLGNCAGVRPESRVGLSDIFVNEIVETPLYVEGRELSNLEPERRRLVRLKKVSKREGVANVLWLSLAAFFRCFSASSHCQRVC